MHKTKIDWADATWNPITGCKHACAYCYAEKMSHRFAGDVRLNLAQTDHYSKEGENYILEKPFPTRKNRALVYPFGFAPTYHKYRLRDLDKWKNGVNIFVCSMADLFGDWVPEQWILDIFQECLKYPQHNYLFLTKNHSRYDDLHEKGLLPQKDNFWYGSTITDESRATYWGHPDYNCFLSIEPLLEDFRSFNVCDVDWMIIGAQSGKGKDVVKPDSSWVKRIDVYCKVKNIPLFMKDSLQELMMGNFKQRLPATLRSKRPSQKLSANCMECGANHRKGDMTTVTLRKGKGGKNRSIGFVCEECLPPLLEKWEVN